MVRSRPTESSGLTPEEHKRAGYAAAIGIGVLVCIGATAVRNALRQSPEKPEGPGQPRLVKPEGRTEGREKAERVILTEEAVRQILTERGYYLEGMRQKLINNPNLIQTAVARTDEATVVAALKDDFPFRREANYKPAAGDHESRGLSIYGTRGNTGFSIVIDDRVLTLKNELKSYQYITITPGASTRHATSYTVGLHPEHTTLSAQQQRAVLEALNNIALRHRKSMLEKDKPAGFGRGTIQEVADFARNGVTPRAGIGSPKGWDTSWPER
jgi:hypothetical protein